MCSESHTTFYMYKCVLYVHVFAVCDLKIVLSLSESESGAAKQSYIPMGGSTEGIYGLVISIEWKYGTGTEHMVSVPATHAVTQVRYTVLLCLSMQST